MSVVGWWRGVRPTRGVSCRPWLGCLGVALQSHGACGRCVVLISTQTFACCGVVLPAIFVLHVCGLCTVLLIARQGTHPYVLNRAPGGGRHL